MSADNRSKRRRERYRLASHFLTMFSEQPESNIEFISPQLKQATLQFLVTSKYICKGFSTYLFIYLILTL